MTPEQDALFAHRGTAGANDICVYYVRSTVPAYNGCAAHSPGQPAVVVAAWAPLWTLAHEVGHVLGLRHVDDDTRLMTGNGTSRITAALPSLVRSEIEILRASPLTR